jgi:DNA topoisomerase-1
VLGNDPVSGKPVIVRAGRFGPYVQLGEAGDGSEKPRTASLFKAMSVPEITLEEALALLQLPRTVGGDPETGEEIVAANGRFGPFLKRGTETRSLETEDQLFTVTIEDALARFAQPKQRRYGTSASPLRELGTDPDSGLPIVLRSGRFGPYVTDGTTNASLRRGDDPDTLTLERAAELIADRRAASPAKPASGRGVRKAAGAKKAGARKAASNKATTGVRKAAGAKKAGARKAASNKATTGVRKAAGAKKAGARKAASTTKKAAPRRIPGAARRASTSDAAPEVDDW